MSAFKPAALLALGVLCITSPALAAVDPAATSKPATLVTSNDYKIGLYDMIDIDVFEISDLHREVQVDGAGRIMLPLIGPVQAAGKTPGQLSEDLRERLEAKFVNNAKVSVQIKQSQSEHVTVDGAVKAPGVYALGGPTTLLQAVAMANGPDGPEANLHKVTVFRTVDQHWTHTQYDLAKIRSGQVEDPVIQGRDVVVLAGSHKQQLLRDLGNILPFMFLVGAL